MSDEELQMDFGMFCREFRPFESSGSLRGGFVLGHVLGSCVTATGPVCTPHLEFPSRISPGLQSPSFCLWLSGLQDRAIQPRSDGLEIESAQWQLRESPRAQCAALLLSETLGSTEYESPTRLLETGSVTSGPAFFTPGIGDASPTEQKNIGS
jgi:hypothetical protein